MEEGIVIGGGCTLLKLAQKVDAIKATFKNEEQRIGAEIVRRALGSPLRLIANNSGTNGAVVMQKVGLQGVRSCRRAQVLASWVGLGVEVKRKVRFQVLGFRAQYHALA